MWAHHNRFNVLLQDFWLLATKKACARAMFSPHKRWWPMLEWRAFGLLWLKVGSCDQDFGRFRRLGWFSPNLITYRGSEHLS